jgi:hypothetical protein
VLAPQTNRLWDAAHLKNIKDVVAALPSVDMDRIYILGHSMGGHGTYILIQIDPGYFAAAAPSAGSGLRRTEEFIDASLIKDVPIWAFHGDKDKVCPIERDQRLFAEMEKLGGNMKLTTWAGDGHGVAEKMITGSDNGSTQLSSERCDPESSFLKWLFAQKLQNRKQQERHREQNEGAGVPRVIVTSDGEIDDQCSMVRFLLYTNEWDVEGIVTSSSQYHWQGHSWPGDDWIDPYLQAYANVYQNLVKHDAGYPTPEYLRKRTFLGNVKAEGEMKEVTAGSQHIVKVLLDETDEQPVWLQAWGGTNTIARALKTIEEEHPERMAEVAKKIRFFFIWEQDSTYQDYIRPHWGKYEIPTIISDQFEAIAYRWDQVQPEEMQKYFAGAWMKENILENHGALCSLYKAKDNGDFRSEGDSPAFLHTIVTGLRNLESPDWGGWGGRYVRVRENTWLDPVPVEGYSYPKGRWYSNSAWGRNSLRKKTKTTAEQRREYFKPMWRWTDTLQNDFASRADWCVKSFAQANHPPVVKLASRPDLTAKPGDTIKLSVKGTTDPDGDMLAYKWWQYTDADSCKSKVKIQNAGKAQASFVVPKDAAKGDTIHVICEVTDNGTPPLTRYGRVIVNVEAP